MNTHAHPWTLGLVALAMAACESSPSIPPETTDSGATTDVSVDVPASTDVTADVPSDDGPAPQDVPVVPEDVACVPVTPGNALGTTSCGTPDISGDRLPYFHCADGPICPPERFANRVMSPGYRITYLNVREPAALANPLLLAVINSAVKEGRFLWGIAFDLTAVTFRSGALNPDTSTFGSVGFGLLDGSFRFFNGDADPLGGPRARFDPGAGSGSRALDRFSTSTLDATVRFPIYATGERDRLLTQLPLENLRFTAVQLTSDRGCVGLGSPISGRYTETTSNWLTSDGCEPYGVMEADITVADSRAIMVNLVAGGSPTPLCDLLSGNPCATTSRPWAREPTMGTVRGAPAEVYHLRAEFAAVSANLL